MDIHDFDFLDQLANEAVQSAKVTPNVTWRGEYERLACAARALANAHLRSTVPENEAAEHIESADDQTPVPAES